MLKIRLTRTGKKHNPTYRLVVAEHTAPVKGKFIEVVGYYLPTRHPKVLELNEQRITYWMSKGATASDTVHNLLVDKKVLTDKRDIKYAKAKAEKAVTEPKPAPKADSDTVVAESLPETDVAAEHSATDTEATNTPDDTVNPEPAA